MTTKKPVTPREKPKVKPRPSASPPKKDIGKMTVENTVELKSSSLDGRLLHISVETDLDDDEVDELHEQIEERIEKKLKENGVENCIVFVSGPNIKLNLM